MERSKLTPETFIAKIEGFFDGKMDELAQEIAEAESWDVQVQIGAKIIRKDQKIDSLLKIEEELRSFQNYVIARFSELHISQNE